MTTHGWHVYWLVWFLVWFTAFIIPEIYALIVNAKWTLSETVWWLEKEHPGEAIHAFSAFHILFGGMLAVVLIWLVGHFIFEIWR